MQTTTEEAWTELPRADMERMERERVNPCPPSPATVAGSCACGDVEMLPKLAPRAEDQGWPQCPAK